MKYITQRWHKDKNREKDKKRLNDEQSSVSWYARWKQSPPLEWSPAWTVTRQPDTSRQVKQRLSDAWMTPGWRLSDALWCLFVEPGLRHVYRTLHSPCVGCGVRLAPGAQLYDGWIFTWMMTRWWAGCWLDVQLDNDEKIWHHHADNLENKMPLEF